jgi:hypothetical protein
MEWNSTGKAAMELGELLLPAKGRKELPTQRTAFYSEE